MPIEETKHYEKEEDEKVYTENSEKKEESPSRDQLNEEDKNKTIILATSPRNYLENGQSLFDESSKTKCKNF